MEKKSLWLGFDIHTTPGPVLQPHRLSFWKDHHFKNQKPESPFHFKADALTGLSLIHLNQQLRNPFGQEKQIKSDAAFAEHAWLALEPHHQMYARCQPRIHSLRAQIAELKNKTGDSFTDKISEVLGLAVQPWGIDLDLLCDALIAFDQLEAKLGSPLIYNFSLRLSKEWIEKLHHLHSLLFNLRVLIAIDHNAHIQDATYEALVVDSISDYLPRAEYVGNDAALYWHFCGLKDKMPAAVSSEMNRAFNHFSHNAICLVDQLPNGFLRSVPSNEMDDVLFLTQMDWLLGTEAGILFRIREELYGLADGYEKIFWQDLENKPHQVPHNLSINCKLTVDDLHATQKSA